MTTYGENPDRLARIILVQVVDVAPDRDREQVVTLPQTANLLVLPIATHFELT